MSREAKRFEFGAHILDAEEKVLLREGERVPIPPKVLELLLVLVDNHGHVVEKESLMKRLWADTFVEESNLTFSIRKLRQILGDNSRDPRFIETIPRRGYRFVADTRVVSHSEHGNKIESGRLPGARDRLGRILRAAAFGTVLIAALGAAAYFYYVYPPGSGGVDWSGAQNVQLTDQPGIEYFPSISPDGKSFVYAADSGSGFDIYHQAVGARNRVDLTADHEGDDTQPAFSPDGQRVAFRSEREGGGIYVMGILREDLRRVADFGYHPAWSPDGRFLAVSTFGRDRITVSTRGEQGIWIIDLETGERRELFRGLASLPAWSPDGRRVAFWFYGNRSGQSDIATISIDGGDPVPVAEGFGSLNWNPVWPPDGRYLYFVSNRGGNQGFWRVPIDPETGRTLGDPEPVGTPATFSRHLGFDSSGSRMIYVQSDLRSNIQGVEFDANDLVAVGEPFWITEGDREVSRAELSPDGKRFQMRLMRRTQDDIVTVARDGTDWRDVTNDAAFDRYSRWSPDGRKIAFASDRSGGNEIWITNADGSDPVQVTSANRTGHVATFPVWSPDGRQVTFSGPEDTYVLDLSQVASEPRKLPRPENGDLFVPWDWSPDGKKLVGRFRPPRPGVATFSFETGRFTRFSYAGDGVPSWLPDGRHVVYSDANKIVLLDTLTLSKREILTTADGMPRSPFVSRDGRLLYWVLHRDESDIWMLDLTTNR